MFNNLETLSPLFDLTGFSSELKSPTPTCSSLEEPNASTSPSSKLSTEEVVGKGKENGKHPIACARCRKLHKRCDKNLTGCTKCAKAGVDCVYTDPKKRGKGAELYAKKPSKKKKTSPTPVVEETQPIQMERPVPVSEKKGLLTPSTVIDVYFTFACGIHPTIEKEKLKYFVHNCLAQFEKTPREELVLENNIWIDSIVEMKCLYAYYLALLVLCSQIVGDLDTVDKYLKKAELEIALLSLEYSSEFYWAAASHCIYIAFIAEGDQYKSGYYQSSVSYYLETHSDSKHPFYITLYNHSTLVISRYKTSVFNLQTLLEGTKNMFEHFTNRKMDEVFLPGTWEYLMNAKISKENFLLFKQVSDFIFKCIGETKNFIQRNLVDCHSQEYFKAQRLFTCLLTETYSFMFMKQIPEISFKVMEEIALKITLLTEHELFPFLLLGSINTIVEISEFHLNICKQIEKGVKPRIGVVKAPFRTATFDYFLLLEKDLKALNVLAGRYRRVKRMYPQLLIEMNIVVERNRTKDFTPIIFSDTISSEIAPHQDEILQKQLDEVFKKTEETNDSSSEVSWDDLFN